MIKLDSTGFSSYFTQAASRDISPILTNKMIEKKTVTSYMYLLESVRVCDSGKVRIIVNIKLITIPNFLRPYLTSVNFSTKGAVTNLRLKGR